MTTRWSFLRVNSEQWVAFNSGMPYREDGVHVRAPWRPREETEEELAAIAKLEGAVFSPILQKFSIEPGSLNYVAPRRLETFRQLADQLRGLLCEAKPEPELEADIMSAIRDIARGG